MDNYTKPMQQGGATVTNYTQPLRNFPQPQMEGKTPLKSRTCQDMPATPKK
jgi:hypothetical protein